MYSVLLVDDKPGVYEMLSAVIDPDEYELSYVSNGAEALESYQQNGHDIVLTDIEMQPMNGITLLTELRKFDPFSIVIMLTGYSSAESAVQSLRGGAFDYLQKPFKIRQLNEVLKRAAEARERNNLLATGGVPGSRAPFAGSRAPFSGGDSGASAAKSKELKEREEALVQRERELEQYEAQLSELERSLGEGGTASGGLSLRDSGDSGGGETETVDSAELQRLRGLVENAQELLNEKEEAIQAYEERIAELEASLAEGGGGGGGGEVDFGGDLDAEMEKLQALKEELAQREETLQASEMLMEERQNFLEESENAVFEKGQALSELETGLDQRRDELEDLQRYLEEQAAGNNVPMPGAAAAGGGGGGGGEGLSEGDLQELERRKAELDARDQKLSEREKKISEQETSLLVRSKSLQKSEALLRAREQFLKESQDILFEAEAETEG